MQARDCSIAAAQIAVRPGDIAANVARHVDFARVAASHGAQIVVFPELSLIGYELDLASRHVIEAESAVLHPLRQTTREGGITLVAGGPMRGQDGVLHIGAFAFRPDGTVTVYTKEHVHASETHVFTSGHGGAVLSVEGEPMALAICADASHLEHAAKAAARGASVYAAGVMITSDAYGRKAVLMERYAQEHSMAVLLANYSGTSGGEVSAGGSAIWAEDGTVVSRAADNAECLVIGARRAGRWQGVVLPMKSARTEPALFRPSGRPAVEAAPHIVK